MMGLLASLPCPSFFKDLINVVWSLLPTFSSNVLALPLSIRQALLFRIARKRRINDLDILQKLTFKVDMAHDEQEVQRYLLHPEQVAEM